MDRPSPRLKKFQFVILGMMVSMIGACAEGTRDKLDIKGPISAKQIFVTDEGRFSQVGVGLPKEHDIKNELEVNGTILAEEILVQAKVADYVFEPTYDLKSLEDIEKFINEHHHLPGIPSKSVVDAAGRQVAIGDSYRVLLEKIEELTLYAIEQNKRIATLEKFITPRYERK